MMDFMEKKLPSVTLTLRVTASPSLFTVRVKVTFRFVGSCCTTSSFTIGWDSSRLTWCTNLSCAGRRGGVRAGLGSSWRCGAASHVAGSVHRDFTDLREVQLERGLVLAYKAAFLLGSLIELQSHGALSKNGRGGAVHRVSPRRFRPTRPHPSRERPAVGLAPELGKGRAHAHDCVTIVTGVVCVHHGAHGAACWHGSQTRHATPGRGKHQGHGAGREEARGNYKKTVSQISLA